MKWILFIYCIFPTVLTHAYIDETLPHSFKAFSSYKPIYAVSGYPNTKIQMSLKAKVVPALPLYVGFTQLLSWDLFQDSSPMKDNNYNPDVFYRFHMGNPDQHRWIDFGGYEHESNGRKGDMSRAWDRMYVRYNDVARLGGEHSETKLHWTVKLAVPINVDRSNNGALAKYRGLIEGMISLSNFVGDFWEEDDLTLRIYLGGSYYLNPLRGGQELTYRARIRERKFFPLFVFQIFHGYAETMIDYKQKIFGFRAGMGF